MIRGPLLDAGLMLAHIGHDHHHDHGAPVADEAGSWLIAAPLVAGLVAGAAHIFTGPDHLAAVAPLAMRDRSSGRGWVAGILWGLGHSTGMWIIAALVLLFREALPLEQLGAWSEWIVGGSLILVGLWGLHGVVRLHVHTHQHVHVHADGHEHAHDHVHIHRRPLTRGTREHDREHARLGHQHGHGLLGVGALHGIAGSSHLVGLLPAMAMPDRMTALVYLVAVGIGSIVGMGVFTGGLTTLFRAVDRGSALAGRLLLAGSSTAALAVGTWWIAATV